ncbi:hypothetical protein PSTT_01194 [Puccinia striiformis]|uniref:Uncharacterized protein n=1 Tax=Puccinia striiformis TaxID=27350 RepID=A0A2S4W4V3_9BASI|nr:hypothetical protein PSTT_01194 [Puccinia striiformis]
MQQLRRQADLAIEGFRRLVAKCEFQCPSTPASTSTPTPIVQSTTSLGSIQLTRRHCLSQLALVLEIQQQIGETLDQTIHTMDDFIPGRVPEPNQTNDRHCKDLKAFRLHGLDVSIREDMRSYLIIIFKHSRKVIEELKTPTKRWPSDIGSMCSELEEIELPISWTKASELYLIWRRWRTDLYDIDHALERLTKLIIPTSTFKGEIVQVLSQPATPLGKSLIPMIRLSKLFFDKLAREGMRRKKAPFDTEMSSQQVGLLNKLVGEIGSCIDFMYEELRENVIQDFDEQDEVWHPDPPSHYSRRMNEMIDRLKTHFPTVMLLVAFYIVPSLPDINDSPAQIHFNDWFITWHTLFIVSTQNAIQAAHVFGETNPP